WDALAADNPAKLAGFRLALGHVPLISPGRYDLDLQDAQVEQRAFTARYQEPPRKLVIKAGGTLDFEVTEETLTIKIPTAAPKGIDVVRAWGAWKKQRNVTHGFDIVVNGTGAAQLSPDTWELTANVLTLHKLSSENTALYYQIKARLVDERVALPPSAAVAGIYASVDRDRGVWKAPANVAVEAAVGPTAKITDEQQGRLNVDPVSGKSINAIRAFN